MASSCNDKHFNDLALMLHAEKLFPINRSLTGDGVRYTLAYFESYHSELDRLKFSSGARVFDWEIPLEWNVNDAYIKHLETGKKYAMFKEHNLHLIGYSQPVDIELDLEDLWPRLYVDKAHADAIPYVTSYYKQHWGFCLSRNQRSQLPSGQYQAFIDSKLTNGFLEMSHALIKGQQRHEVFFSSYICHPSMANNELSGPIVLAAVLDYIKQQYPSPKFTYRFVLLPETLGSIAYLSKYASHLKEQLIAGFNLSCVGDNRAFSVVHSPYADTLADKALNSALFGKDNTLHYSYLQRGSDERQYCSALLRLPVCTFCRSKFEEYPEYHTSLDDLTVISEEGLLGSVDILKNIIDAFELGLFPLARISCEPQLGKRGLYHQLSTKDSEKSASRKLLDVLSYADGSLNLFDIAIACQISLSECINLCTTLLNHDLITFTLPPDF